MMDRNTFSDLIFKKITEQKAVAKQQFLLSKKDIGYFFIDDLLPSEMVTVIQNAFPEASKMMHKKSLSQDKYVASQMNLYEPILEEIIYAFQDHKIVNLVGVICEIDQIFPDDNLYAGGISMMKKNQFLNPHLDNSHDKNREHWRVLNLLFYTTANWKEEFGGNLELWPNGLKEDPITIHSKFNRLVVMVTHNKSLHSVSPVVHDGSRCCVSNYYFSPKPVLVSDQFHVTSFRGRPADKYKDLILKFDTFVRMNVRRIFKKGIIENPHVYKK